MTHSIEVSLKCVAGALISGLIFGFGLMVSGMANPAKVIGFLDVTGSWDPSLVFVMVGAIALTMLGYWLLTRYSSIDASGSCAPKSKIDRPLVVGAIVFGIGWGLIGLCPGPAFTLVASAPMEALKFVGPMLIGLLIGGAIKHKI